MASLRAKLAWMGIALVAGMPSAATATEIFSTFGPGSGYTTSSYMPVNFYTSPEIIGTQIAFAFDIPGTQDWRLDRIELAASWDGTKENARFTLHDDDAGLPAATPLAVLGENPASLAHFPAITIIALTSASSPRLEHGRRYWFSVAPASLDANVPADDFVMLWLNPDGVVTQTSRNWFGAGPWEPWFSPPFEWSRPAFRVFAAPVPLPPALPLLGTAAGCCLAGARRRRAAT